MSGKCKRIGKEKVGKQEARREEKQARKRENFFFYNPSTIVSKKSVIYACEVKPQAEQ